MFNIGIIMEKLAAERPVFHSEADFQFALAWKIQDTYPAAKIRLEKSVPGLEDSKSKYSKNRYIDIMVIIDGKEIPIELKYKTRKKCKDPVKVKNEEYNLKNQGAQDNGRYDFFRDISKIEKYLNFKNTNCDYGYAIILTNDHLYYEPGRDSNSSQFRIDKEIERIKSGEHDWKSKSESFKTYNSNRFNVIKLKHSYDVEWKDYPASEEIGKEFKFLIVTIKK